MGDVHIYNQHYDQVKKQLERSPHQFPKISFKKELKELKDIEDLQSSDIVIENYRYYPAIKAEMIA